MTPAELTNLSRLCIHTITTKPWTIEEAAVNYAAAGVQGITVWREALRDRNITQTGKMLRDHNLTVVSLCRGGFFPHKDQNRRRSAIDDNRKAIEEAAELGTGMLVLVCGADPDQPLEESRKQIRYGIAALISDASAAGVKLAIEPLHPMYADTRSAINTLAQANDITHRQVTVAHLAAARPPVRAHFAHGKSREIIMQKEFVVPMYKRAVNHLLVILGTECHRGEGLGLSTGEHR